MAYQFQAKSPGVDTQIGDVLIVVHDFEARSTDELTLRKGEKISLVELDDGFGDGWFLGKHLSRGNMGLFPGVYTQKMLGWTSVVRTPGPSVRASLPAEPEVFKPNTLNPHLVPQPPITPQNQQEKTETERKIIPDSPVEKATESDHFSSETSEPRRPPSPRAPNSAPPIVPRSLSQAIVDSKGGEDSPVMNETLTVINEHITDLSTPRHSLVGHDTRNLGDSASEYSTTLSRISYVAGPETDEEEEEMYSHANVKSWSPGETASYLRQIGVDSKHCDIFEEQEISGDVLLEMDKDFIHMKEYDFGVMGRRLKTWHKIRRFQEEVKGTKKPRRRSISYASTISDAGDDRERRSPSTASSIPPVPGLLRNPGSLESVHPEHVPAPLQPGSFSSSSNRFQPAAGSPLPPLRTFTQDSSSRPPTVSASRRSHNRRHSSLDIALGPISEVKSKTAGLFGRSAAHKKQGSFDRNWSMVDPTPASHSHPEVGEIPSSLNQKLTMNNSDTSISGQQALADLDRGYFSGPESEPGKARNFLRKKDGVVGAAHSRHSSFVDQHKRESVAKKRQSRLGSADSVKDMIPAVTSPAASAYHSRSFRHPFRSASARAAMTTPPMGGTSPTVTNLEIGKSPAMSMIPPKAEGDAGGKISPHPSLSGRSSTKHRRFGLRTVSDNVTGQEMNMISSPTSIPSSFKDSPVESPSRTGSSTPSPASRSLEIDNPEGSLKDSRVPRLLAPPGAPVRSKAKTKKDTSAYQKGLLKKTPTEQRVDCDYSGWMKKKSSSLMTTWKPRLFFLKGRRLSYYYAEDDTEERGVIDISSHKVLKADHDPITNLHASLTGSTSSPVVQSPPGTSKTAPSPRIKSPSSISPFFFKLIPPKAGLSRAVQFTKPTIHYFQVDTVQEGRRWMAAMMKATIEYDPSFGLETTNKQKTISLAKARERKERPPALQGEDSIDKEQPPIPKHDGLNIRGLTYDGRTNTSPGSNGMASTHKKGGSGGELVKEKSRSVSRSRAVSETATRQTPEKTTKIS